MIFWDASALVPLVVREASSTHCEGVARADGDLIVWWGTPVEVLSALARRERDGTLSAPDTDRARATLRALAEVWNEVLPVQEVRERASVLLRRHAIRAADALQLGAAMTWAQDRTRARAFFTLDDRMMHAARGEGFDLVPVA